MIYRIKQTAPIEIKYKKTRSNLNIFRYDFIHAYTFYRKKYIYKHPKYIMNVLDGEAVGGSGCIEKKKT